MEKFKIPFPLTCITYASPYVGGSSFNEAFEFLEENGRLRHIRVSNEKDLVPVAPPGRYVHTGLNVHIRPGGKCELGYQSSKSWGSQLSWWLMAPLDRHGLADYWTRGQKVEKEYLNSLKEGDFTPLTIDHLYDNLASFNETRKVEFPSR